MQQITFQPIAVSVIANLVAAFILALLAIGTYCLVFLIERRQLLRFFGISRKLPRMRFYLSRLEIKPGGTIGFEPLTAGYSGPSINKIEYEGALLLCNKLRSSMLVLLPKRLQDWLIQQYASLIIVDPSIDVSPKDSSTIPFDNMVVLGSSIYNLIAKYYLEHPSCQFYFARKEEGERVIRIRTGGLKDVEIPGRSRDRELGIIQRINDTKHGNTVFLCAGLSSSATFGCARFLTENWRQLQRQYKDAEFGICLGFPDQLPDSESVMEPIQVYPKSDGAFI